MSLDVHALTVRYNGRTVLDHIDLSIAPGKITAIIGPNGCGKSTLMRVLSGLLTPDAGMARLSGSDLKDWPRRALARQMALLPQSPLAPDGMSMRRVIEHGRFAHQGLFSGASAEDRAIVSAAIAQVGLTALAERPFSRLSGGERQRAWIALALAQKPEWLLLDEPTTFLDIGHQFEVLDLLATLNRTDGLGIVMVLHDINQAAAYADRIIAIKDGKVVADGHPARVITGALVAELFGITVRLVEMGRAPASRPHCIALPAHMEEAPPARSMLGANP